MVKQEAYSAGDIGTSVQKAFLRFVYCFCFSRLFSYVILMDVFEYSRCKKVAEVYLENNSFKFAWESETGSRIYFGHITKLLSLTMLLRLFNLVSYPYWTQHDVGMGMGAESGLMLDVM